MLQQIVFILGLLLSLTQANYPFEDPTLTLGYQSPGFSFKIDFARDSRVFRSYIGKTPASAERINVHPYQFLNECLRGLRGANATAFPQSLGISASFR